MDKGLARLSIVQAIISDFVGAQAQDGEGVSDKVKDLA
jgi:hypothetical protein